MAKKDCIILVQHIYSNVETYRQIYKHTFFLDQKQLKRPTFIRIKVMVVYICNRIAYMLHLVIYFIMDTYCLCTL